MIEIAYVSITLQLAGSAVTAIGLALAGWKVRDVLSVLRKRGEVSISTIVAGQAAEGFGSATMIVVPDWSESSAEEQLEAIHKKLAEHDETVQKLAHKLSITEHKIESTRSNIKESEIRHFKRTDKAVKNAIESLQNDSKIDLAFNLMTAASGLLLTTVGTAISYGAV